MIKHIVLFKLKNFPDKTAKSQKMDEIKAALMGLQEKVDVLKSIEIGLNSNPNEKFDVALTTTFDTMEDLHAYAVHPDHVKAGAIIREVLEERACVDYEV